MGFSGSLEKLKITAFEDSKFKRQGPSLEVWINPEKYTHNFKICYTNTQGQGSSGGSPDFNRIPPDDVTFELVFDGTGVVPTALPGVIPDLGDGVTEKVDKFKKLVFGYNGNIHSPNFLQLAWGTLLFKCRLQKMGLEYTLFKPDGTPLRARASCTFIGFNDEEELSRKANRSSPDMTHVVTVKAGDTLPLLCWRIYGDESRYPEVAAANRLTGFRHLEVGSQLLFPPVEGTPS